MNSPDSKIKILCCVAHYYRKHRYLSHKSSYQNKKIRKMFVNNSLFALKSISTMDRVSLFDLKVCGIKEKSLVTVDIDFSFLSEPQLIVYEMLAYLSSRINDYDYFIGIEDDVILPKETFSNILEFDKRSAVNECLHPNRIEIKNGHKDCVDLKAIPGWGQQRKHYLGHELRVAFNPHSGILVLSKEKMGYCLDNIDINFRGLFLKNSGLLESAFAYFHKPFLLYRYYDDQYLHTVVHQDCCSPVRRFADLCLYQKIKTTASLFKRKFLKNILLSKSL
jgi:hypothetical protein